MTEAGPNRTGLRVLYVLTEKILSIPHLNPAVGGWGVGVFGECEPEVLPGGEGQAGVVSKHKGEGGREIRFS